MSRSVVRLPMASAASAVRIVAVAKEGPQPAPAGRLLELRDAASEQRLVREAVDACRAAVERALRELRSVVDARVDAVASMSTELGLVVASEIVGATLARGVFDPLPIVRRCLQQALAAGERSGVVVRLSPADLVRVQSEPVDARVQGVTFAADAALAPGSVRVETDVGTIAYDPAEVLRRLSDELRKELASCR